MVPVAPLVLFISAHSSEYDNVYSKSHFLQFSVYLSSQAFKRALNLSLNSVCSYTLVCRHPEDQKKVVVNNFSETFVNIHLYPLYIHFPLSGQWMD